MRDNIVSIIVEALQGIQTEYPRIEIREPHEKIRIYGGEGALDSLGIVNLAVAIEEKIYEKFGKVIIVVSEKAVSQKVSPFLTVGTLARYIESLVRMQDAQ